jgi:hypothetical protein
MAEITQTVHRLSDLIHDLQSIVHELESQNNNSRTETLSGSVQNIGYAGMLTGR